MLAGDEKFVGSGRALLVRPDGYVAWALGPNGTDDLLEALTTWFGDPQPALRA